MQYHSPGAHNDPYQLRQDPKEGTLVSKAMVLQDEVVEAITPSTSGYTKVRLTFPAGTEGWIADSLLHWCPEGTAYHGDRICDFRYPTQRVELDPVKHKDRFDAVKQLVEGSCCGASSCPVRSVALKVKKIFFLKNTYLGEDALERKDQMKELWFHGKKDAICNSVVDGGFDLAKIDKFGGAFGRPAFGFGHYFTTQACKAWSYAENQLFLCEVAPGTPAERYTITDYCKGNDFASIRAGGHYSATCSPSTFATFLHEERVSYKNTMCKPVYLVETQNKSPGGGK